MEKYYLPLTAYSEEQRQTAIEKYKLLIPYLQKKRLFQDAHYNIG